MRTPIRTGMWLAATLWAVLTPLQAAEALKPDTSKPAVNREQMEQKLQAAQQRLEQAAQEMAELSMSLNDAAGPQTRRIARTIVRRPMLGIAIDMQRRGDGVRVVSVSPGGGAEAAGIKANDIIVSLDGNALRSETNRPAQQQLLDIARAAKPGVPLAVEYQRDGKLTRTQIVPEQLRASLPDFNVELNMPDLPGLQAFTGPGGEGVRVFGFQSRTGTGFGSAELVELSPALGAYFGADKGLLVVRAPRDASFKLQDGDVLLDIDGRVPGSVSHAVQILDSYRAGETARLHILRQKKRMELTVTVPTAGNRPSLLREPPRPLEPPRPADTGAT